MTKTKIVLIGNSGIGKSTCCREVSTNPELASMDKKFGKDYPGLDSTLRWIVDETNGEAILEASAHEQLFWDLAEAKRKKHKQLETILFVFLYNSAPDVRLNRINDSGRGAEAVQTPLAWDAMVNDLCHYIADIAINTATMKPVEVAAIVKAVSWAAGGTGGLSTSA